MKKITLLLLLISSSFALHAMLPRTGVKILTRQVSTQSTATGIPLILKAIIAIPTGWFGALAGGALGLASGGALGIVPAILLGDNTVFDNSGKAGAAIGAIVGGIGAAYATARMRGVISCGATSATLYAIGQWNIHKKNRLKEKPHPLFESSADDSSD